MHPNVWNSNIHAGWNINGCIIKGKHKQIVLQIKFQQPIEKHTQKPYR